MPGKCFEFLGSIFQSYGDIQQDVTQNYVWVIKMESDYLILVTMRLRCALRAKGKFYRLIIRPTLLYKKKRMLDFDHCRKMEIA